ncbi:MAG: transglutaminase domain-containing protein [Anaerolineales bacterium]|nr:transglutaminase domain-containing protein [Anaerolineales bacterium]
MERYLRTFPYDLSVPPLPEAVTDVADYFLFDLQRGYCDYYATSFVVLARAAGIPARFVTGFTSGAWNPTEQVWTVTEANAHSWPEVYFPAVGWVPFEPTAGRPELTRLGVTRSADNLPAPPLTVGRRPPRLCRLMSAGCGCCCPLACCWSGCSWGCGVGDVTAKTRGTHCCAGAAVKAARQRLATRCSSMAPRSLRWCWRDPTKRKRVAWSGAKCCC